MNTKIGQITDASEGYEVMIEEMGRELKRVSDGAHAALIDRAQSVTDFESIEASDVSDLLESTLDDYAPPYCYFGSSIDEGELLGFWLYPGFKQRIIDDGHQVINDLAALKDNYTGEALFVNDHGNCIFYSVENGEPVEIWSLV